MIANINVVREARQKAADGDDAITIRVSQR